MQEKYTLPEVLPDWVDKVELLGREEAYALAKLGVDVQVEWDSCGWATAMWAFEFHRQLLANWSTDAFSKYPHIFFIIK